MAPIGGVRAGYLSAGKDDIPDSVVSRESDDSSFSTDIKFGVRFDTAVDWPKIGAKLSSNHSGGTRAYLYAEASGSLVDDVDISGISAGDTFVFDNAALTGGDSYRIVVGAEGSTYNSGIDDNPTFPYTSPDGDLTITGGANDATTISSDAHNIIELGNVGF